MAKKGREMRHIPEHLAGEFDEALVKEWTKWVKYDSVETMSRGDQDAIGGEDVLPLRLVKTDKAEQVRGDQTFEEVPVEAKVRVVTQGYKDKDRPGHLRGRVIQPVMGDI